MTFAPKLSLASATPAMPGLFSVMTERLAGFSPVAEPQMTETAPASGFPPTGAVRSPTTRSR